MEDAIIKEQELLGMAEDAKKLALKEKKANNIEQAKKHLQTMKRAEAELEELYSLYPKLKKNQQKQEVQKQPEQKVAHPA